MKENNRKLKMPAVVKILLHPADGNYTQCTEQTRNNFFALSLVLAFAASTCGTILGCSISIFGFDSKTESYVLAISIGILFYWLVDNMVIMADAKKNLAFIIRSRYFIAIIFGLLNSFLVDSLWFHKDVDAERKKEIFAALSAIDSTTNKIKNEYISSKTGLYNKIDNASGQMKQRMDSLITEYQGKSVSGLHGDGKDYKIKYAAFKNDSLEFARTNSLMMSEAVKYDTLISQLDQQTISLKSEVPGQFSEGIDHSMELLYRAVWINGSIINKLMALLMLFGAMFLELLPLLAKHYFDIEEYFEFGDNEKRANKVNSHLRIQNQISRDAHRLNFENKRMMDNEYAEHCLESLKDEFKFNEDMLNAADEQLEMIDSKNTRMKKRWSVYYDEHIKPVFIRIFERIKRSNEKAFDKQKIESI